MSSWRWRGYYALVMDVLYIRHVAYNKFGGRTGMSNETDTGIRSTSNFASRLLSKAIAERGKTGEHKKVTVADAAQYATATPTAVEEKQAAVATKE
jgi:hypothetical protein